MLHISQFYISNLAMKASCSRERDKTNFHPHYKEQYKYINNNFRYSIYHLHNIF